ncbi:MAG: 30S ribosomal protein S20 [Magnetococcus sp. DMHC-6]
MANIKSSIKSAQKTIQQNARNKDARSRMRNIQKQLILAVDAGDLDKARETLPSAAAVLGVSVRKGVIHRNQAARRLHRLNLKVRKLSEASQAHA